MAFKIVVRNPEGVITFDSSSKTLKAVEAYNIPANVGGSVPLASNEILEYIPIGGAFAAKDVFRGGNSATHYAINYPFLAVRTVRT